MEIMNLCVLHLSDIERDTGSGVDREELIQWYLEQKEMDFESEEDLEYERELIAKALTKLAKVSPGLVVSAIKKRMLILLQDNYLLEIRGDVNSSLDPSAAQDETMDQDESAEGDKVYYVVHPQVDLSDLSSSLAS